MGSLRCWKDRCGEFASRSLLVIGTGPSFNLFDKAHLNSQHIFAINAAITETWQHKPFWVCHDFQKIFRHGLRARIRGYHWQLITRRCLIPGKFGAVPYRDVGGGRITSRFPHVMNTKDVAQADIYWYADLRDQHGFVPAEETSLEIALEVATGWGFNPIVLVGFDMGYQEGKPYGDAWSWKRCCIRPNKFEAMKRALTKNRARWPSEIYTLSPYWKGPFSRIDQKQLRQYLDQGTTKDL